jgi:arylsulfatase
MICTDHWSGNLLGAEGHTHIMTPTLDRLCDQGTRYTRAYTTTPTCIPARRALMTGTSAKTHGDRVFSERLRMDPNLPTLAETLGVAGYQTSAVGKLHVFPQRSKIGFDEVILNEEGRHHLGMVRDDYEIHLSDDGFHGEELTHAMGNNVYTVRPWHLPERNHQTYWTTKQTCRAIQRRDPDKPGFWYCSYAAPHPPIVPPRDYLDMYDGGVDEPCIGDWARDFASMPYALQTRANQWRTMDTDEKIARARMGFYAQCTYIDHQMRLLLGTLREEGLLDSTYIVFTADHGDMLGNHGQWAKPPMCDSSARIPLIVVPPKSVRAASGPVVDDRLAALRDIMPTLLDACGVTVPDTVEGLSLFGDSRRKTIYCEHYEDERALRMIRDERYKLMWYPAGNRFQLFDMLDDPDEMHELSTDPHYTDILDQLRSALREELYGIDLDWVENDRFVGIPEPPVEVPRDTGLIGQRGWRL